MPASRTATSIGVEYARVIVYRSPDDIEELHRHEAAGADLVVKHSGVGADDELLEARVVECRSERTRVAFWDVDAPATLARVEDNPCDPFRRLIPQYDFIFTYGGGRAGRASITWRWEHATAIRFITLWTRRRIFPVAADPALACDLLFVGNRLPDREKRVEHFFLRAAELAPEMNFILGRRGLGPESHLPPNVRWHRACRHRQPHNRLNCSARMVLNINRESMANVGFSPPTRIFEAAGAGACLVTDRWTGH